MIKRNFILKTISCIIIVAAILYYNEMMELNSELVEANTRVEQIVEEFESGAGTVKKGKYKDGVYSGSAQGYGGTVTTEITITNGNISNISIVSSDKEDAAYYNMCLGILDQIVAAQSADVDTVSGATYTSNGIINGAKDALKQAGQ